MSHPNGHVKKIIQKWTTILSLMALQTAWSDENRSQNNNEAKECCLNNPLQLSSITECLVDELQRRYLLARCRIFCLLEKYKSILHLPLRVLLHSNKQTHLLTNHSNQIWCNIDMLRWWVISYYVPTELRTFDSSFILVQNKHLHILT